jgi:hypothetical protein
MRHIFVFLILLALLSCSKKPKPTEKCIYEPGFFLKTKEGPNVRPLAEINHELDSMTAAGHYILSRGSDREYDTIIMNNIRVRFIKDE